MVKGGIRAELNIVVWESGAPVPHSDILLREEDPRFPFCCALRSLERQKGAVLGLQTCKRLMQKGREQCFLFILCGQDEAYFKAAEARH